MVQVRSEAFQYAGGLAPTPPLVWILAQSWPSGSCRRGSGVRSWVWCCVQGLYKFHQYQVVGRHLPTENEAEPPIYRMKLWATDPVRAKSKFW